MQQANIINMITNKYEPQQKHRLGTVSKKLLGGLNRFYGYPNSPSASVMAQNIQLFGLREGFLTQQWIVTQINTMMKQRWGLDRNVLRPTPGDPWGVEDQTRSFLQLYYLDYIWAAAWPDQQNDMCLAKTQICLNIRPVWLVFLRVAKDLMFLHAVLIRLDKCPGKSESLLGTQVIMLVLLYSGSFVGEMTAIIKMHSQVMM